MNEGKELLIDIIKNTNVNKEDNKVLINGIDINSLYSELYKDASYLGNIDDSLIDEIIKKNKYQRHIIFIKKLYQLRDLYLGKNKYNIKLEDKEDYKKTMDTFLDLVGNLIDKNANIDVEDRLNILLAHIKFNEIIEDKELIEYIVKEYDPANFDNNMLSIMEYISNHNYNILNGNSLEETFNMTSELKINDVDDEVKEILKKLEINYKELPLDYKFMIKNTSKEQIKNIFNLIKHNKVEDYGILHLIDRSNETAKLCILLYATEQSIKDVVETFRDNNGDLDIKSIKKLINIILPVFVYKDNDICRPLYYTYMDNIKLFNKYDINIISLLNKCPLLFITDNSVIENVLNIFNKYKVEEKKVINKLYKSISTNPDVILTNLEVLKKYINIDEYLQGTNYNLLKVKDLNKKIKYIVDKYETNDPEDITNYLVKELFDNQDKNMWGDLDA